MQDGINTLNAAIANKVALDTVNVMTMDYGPADIDMGAAAISAAQGCTPSWTPPTRPSARSRRMRSCGGWSA